MPQPEQHGFTFAGKTPEEMTKEELIAAIYDLVRTRDLMRKLHEDYVATMRDWREMR